MTYAMTAIGRGRMDSERMDSQRMETGCDAARPDSSRDDAARVNQAGATTGTPRSGAPQASRALVPDALSPDALRESALAQRAATGDTDAFRQLVERYQRPMAALISRMIGSPDDVDDILQEVFLRAWRGLPNFRHDAQFSTWLYRIAVNTSLKHRGKSKTEKAQSILADDIVGGLDQMATPTDASPDRGGDPAQAALNRERDEKLREAIQSLPEKQRVVIALHYFEGHSCEEIGRLLDCSVGTIWSRLHYACKRLKETLANAPEVAR